MSKEAKKRCPAGVHITDMTTGKVYKPGQIVPKDMWNIFEQYVEQVLTRAAPGWKAKTQMVREFQEDGKKRLSRTDIEMHAEDGRIWLFECKNYNSNYISSRDIAKIVRDRRVSKAERAFLVISHTTKISAARKEELEKNDIRMFVAECGWEKKIEDLFREKGEAEDKPGEKKTVRVVPPKLKEKRAAKVAADLKAKPVPVEKKVDFKWEFIVK